MSKDIAQKQVVAVLKANLAGLTIDEIAEATNYAPLYIRDVLRGLRKVKHSQITEVPNTWPIVYAITMPRIEIEYHKLAQLQQQLLASVALINSLPDISEE